MTEDVLLVEKSGAICTLTLNRPQRLNAINVELGRRLIEALEDCAEDDNVRAIVLAGAGRAFCAGDDMRGSGALPAAGARRRDFIDGIRVRGRYVTFIEALKRTAKPIVAKVHGFAYGAGCDLVLASDIAIAAEDAQFAAVFVKRGMVSGTFLLPRVIGPRKATEMLLTGEPVDGKTAAQLGIVSYAVPLEKLDETVSYWAAKLAAGPTRVMAYIKLAINRGLTMSMEDSLLFAATMQDIASFTEDRAEGMASFREKRPPSFKGR